jgi:uncharacterized protein YlxW (UPF0749 family)
MIYEMTAEVTGVSLEKLKGTSTNHGDERGLVLIILNQEFGLRMADIAKLIGKNRSNTSAAHMRTQARVRDLPSLSAKYEQLKAKVAGYKNQCHDLDAELFRSHARLKLENRSLREELNAMREKLAIWKNAYNIQA